MVTKNLPYSLMMIIIPEESYINILQVLVQMRLKLYLVC